MKAIIYLITLVTLINSCNQPPSNEDKQEYYANIVLGDASMKADFPTLAIKYANWAYDYNIDPDSTLKYIHEIDKKQSGGEEAMGTLSITKDSVKYIPQEIYKYIFDGIVSFNIPINDIISAEQINNDKVIFHKQFRINTKNGSFTFRESKKVLVDFHLSKSYDKEICDKINDLVTKQ